MLEASNVTGGRALTIRGLREAQIGDLGLSLFRDSDFGVRSWSAELGIPVRRVENPNTLWLEGQLHTRESTEPAVRLAWEAWDDLGNLASALDVRMLDQISLTEHLIDRGLPDEVVKIVGVITTPILCASPDTVSALHAVREAERWRHPAWQFNLGASRLPEMMTKRLGERVRHEAAVVAVEHNDHAVALTLHTGERVYGHRAVFAIPPPLLTEIEFDPPLPDLTRHALESVPMADAAVALIQCRPRPWSAQVVLFADEPPMMVQDFARSDRRRHALLTVRATGALARALGDRSHATAERDAIMSIVIRLNTLWPGMMDAHVASVAHHWGAQPWIRGLRSHWSPGSLMQARGSLLQAEGRLHFAGEHTAIHPGSLEAMLQSARRVASEIAAL